MLSGQLTQFWATFIQDFVSFVYFCFVFIFYNFFFFFFLHPKLLFIHPSKMFTFATFFVLLHAILSTLLILVKTSFFHPLRKISCASYTVGETRRDTAPASILLFWWTRTRIESPWAARWWILVKSVRFCIRPRADPGFSFSWGGLVVRFKILVRVGWAKGEGARLKNYGKLSGSRTLVQVGWGSTSSQGGRKAGG